MAEPNTGESGATMRYLCLAYREATFLGEAIVVERAAGDGESDAELEDLRRRGRAIAGGVVHDGKTATTVRVRDGAMTAAPGPRDEQRARLRQFWLIEARDLNDAIRVASRLPLARIGWIEVWPIDAADQ
jgi:hypothetical protein